MGFSGREPWLRQALASGMAKDVTPARIIEPEPEPARKPGNVSVAIGGPVAWLVSLTLPCRVVSEANKRGWREAHRRKVEQEQAWTVALVRTGLAGWRPRQLPDLVRLVHVGKGRAIQMDDDNLRRAFKGIRDMVARWLGIDDGDRRIRWDYGQERGEAGVLVQIGGTA